MGAYKKLNKQDVYVTSYEANKSFRIAGDDEFETFNVDGFYIESSSLPYYEEFYDSFEANSGTRYNRYTSLESLVYLEY